MGRLILINGNGGAGKKTNSQLLYSKLPDSAWIHMRWLLALKSSQPMEKSVDLGIRNAAAVINNYFDEGVQQVIYSGNVYSQESLDRLLEWVSLECEVNYFWLDADKSALRVRLINRARDSGDKPSFVNWLLSSPYYFSDPPALVVPGGNYFVIDTNSKPPEQIVEEIISRLKVSRTEDKDLFVP